MNKMILNFLFYSYKMYKMCAIIARTCGMIAPYWKIVGTTEIDLIKLALSFMNKMIMTFILHFYKIINLITPNTFQRSHPLWGT